MRPMPQPYRKPKRGFGVVGVVALLVICALALGVLRAWAVMLLLGAFAHETGYGQFALGFWPSLIATYAVAIAAFTPQSSTKN